MRVVVTFGSVPMTVGQPAFLQQRQTLAGVLKKAEEGRGFSPAEKRAPIFSITSFGAFVRRS